MAETPKVSMGQAGVATAAIVAFFGFLYYWVTGGEIFRRGPAPIVAPVVDNAHAIVICQHLVTAQLKSPKTADFPFLDRPSVARTGDSFTVLSYVDSQNTFGAVLRTNFSCKVTHKGGEGTDPRNWTLDALTFPE